MRRYWTADEDQILIKAWPSARTVASIGRGLKRSPSACFGRMRVLRKHGNIVQRIHDRGLSSGQSYEWGDDYRLTIVSTAAFLWMLEGLAREIPPQRLTWQELRPGLEKLWAEGLTAAQIAVRLNRPLSSVLTMRCRFKLPRRQTPSPRAGRPPKILQAA